MQASGGYAYQELGRLTIDIEARSNAMRELGEYIDELVQNSPNIML
jgi:hypothetical protein